MDRNISVYDDIINLPHHKSLTRKPMASYNRAAQFAPFSAVVGHDKAIEETARKTDNKIELDEYQKEEINYTLLCIVENIDKNISARVTYFVPDELKSGGAYVKTEGIITELREFEKEIVIDDSISIPTESILELNLQEDFICNHLK